jgi:hypothetical protein
VPFYSPPSKYALTIIANQHNYITFECRRKLIARAGYPRAERLLIASWKTTDISSKEFRP